MTVWKIVDGLLDNFEYIVVTGLGVASVAGRVPISSEINAKELVMGERSLNGFAIGLQLGTSLFAVDLIFNYDGEFAGLRED